MKMTRDLIKVERRIKEVLKPVTPSMEFVTELRLKLDEEMIKRAKTKKVQTGLLVAGGLVSLAVMVVAIIRSLAKWPEMIKSISKNLPKQRKRQQAASL